MFPNLISLGPLSIKTYGACMALGFLAAWQVMAWLCRKTNRSAEILGNLLILLMATGVLGSRIAYVIEHWRTEFADNPWQVVRVDQGGLMFYGGLILATLTFFVWAFRRHERILPLADLLACVVPLGHAFGRIGCFFYGCCYGKISDAPIAVSFPRGSPAWYEQLHAGLITASAGASIKVLPTQLVEALCVSVLFGILLTVYRRFWQRFPGLVTGCYFAGYAIIRFGLEYLRGDPRAAVGPFSISQTISLALLTGGLALVACACRRRA